MMFLSLELPVQQEDVEEEGGGGEEQEEGGGVAQPAPGEGVEDCQQGQWEGGQQ